MLNWHKTLTKLWLKDPQPYYVFLYRQLRSILYKPSVSLYECIHFKNSVTFAHIFYVRHAFLRNYKQKWHTNTDTTVTKPWILRWVDELSSGLMIFTGSWVGEGSIRTTFTEKEYFIKHFVTKSIGVLTDSYWEYRNSVVCFIVKLSKS